MTAGAVRVLLVITPMYPGNVAGPRAVDVADDDGYVQLAPNATYTPPDATPEVTRAMYTAFLKVFKRNFAIDTVLAALFLMPSPRSPASLTVAQLSVAKEALMKALEWSGALGDDPTRSRQALFRHARNTRREAQTQRQTLTEAAELEIAMLLNGSIHAQFVQQHGHLLDGRTKKERRMLLKKFAQFLIDFGCPLLGGLLNRLCHIPAASAWVEGFFSQHDEVKGEHRGKLLPQTTLTGSRARYLCGKGRSQNLDADYEEVPLDVGWACATALLFAAHHASHSLCDARDCNGQPCLRVGQSVVVWWRDDQGLYDLAWKGRLDQEWTEEDASKQKKKKKDDVDAVVGNWHSNEWHCLSTSADVETRDKSSWYCFDPRQDIWMLAEDYDAINRFIGRGPSQQPRAPRR
jgi:hypothetical protein